MEAIRDGVMGFIWFVVSFASAYFLFRSARRLFPEDPPWLMMMHVTVAAWACLVGVCFLLGTVRLLLPLPLMAGVMACTSLTWMMVHREVPRLRGAPIKPQNEHSGISARVLLAIGLLTIAALSGVVIKSSVFDFPSDWDTLMYHLPLVDTWLREGSLYAPDCPLWYNAANLELIALWLVAPFSGDFWAQLANLPVVFLLCLGTWELGRLLGLTLGIRNATALAVVATDVVFRQATSLKNDVAVAALMVAGIAYGLRFVREGRRGDLWLTAASLGLLPGVKYYALGYTVVAWMGLLALAFHRRGAWEAFRMARGGAGGTLLFAGYWYARNALVTGIPLYPLGISNVTDRLGTLHPGIWKTTLLGNDLLVLLPNVFEATASLGGYVYAVGIFVLPTTVLWLVLTGFLGERSRSETRWIVAWLTCSSLFVFTVTPFTVDPASNGREIFSNYIVVRFNMCGLVFSTLALAIVMSDVSCALRQAGRALSRVPAAALALGTLCPIVTVAKTAVDDLIVLALITTGLMSIVTLFLLVRRLRPTGDGALVYLLMIGALVTAGTSTAWGKAWHDGFARHYDMMFRTDIFTRLDRLGEPRPAIAVLGYRYYPYFGSRRAFRVVRPKSIPSSDSFYELLMKERIGIISVTRNDPTFAGRYRDGPLWVAQRAEMFESFGHRGSFDVYWVRSRMNY